MSTLKTPLLLVLAALFAVFTACQPKNTTTEEDSKITDIPLTTDSEKAMKAFKEGQKLLDLGDNQNARTSLNNALAEDPGLAFGYILRSFTAGSGEEFAADINEANKHLEGLSEGEKLIVEISNTFMTGDVEQQIALSENLVKAYPDAARAYNWLGLAYGGNNQIDLARKNYMKAIELDPEFIGARVSLGNSYIFNDPKDFAKATEHMAKTVELMPDQAYSHINLGDCYRANKDLEKALAAYTKATQVDPTNPVAHGKTGHVNSLLGNYDEARKNYQDNRKYSIYKGGGLNFEAFTYLYEGDYKKALKWLGEQAAKLEEHGVAESQMNGVKMGCINACSWIAFHNGEVGHIKELVSMRAPVSTAIGEDLGTEEGKIGQKANQLMWEGLAAAMEKDYKTASAKAEEHKTTLEPINNPRKLEGYHFMHGYINLKQGNHAEAVAHLEKSNPNSIYHKYTLALANDAAGNKEKAMELFNEIADFNFNNVQYAVVRNDVKKRIGS